MHHAPCLAVSEENQKIRIRLKELIELLVAADRYFREDLPLSAGLTLSEVSAKSKDLSTDLIKRR